ncbi:MAG: hypothetical protein IT168_02875 [Bryobacterales bacterium]|nr:hypothetical protein [Bryobacterales bacterium]
MTTRLGTSLTTFVAPVGSFSEDDHHACMNAISKLPKCIELRLSGFCESGVILERPVKEFGNRAFYACLVADGDHEL